jgi:hypothetical protein
MKTQPPNAFASMLDNIFARWKEPDPATRARVADMLRKFHAGIPVNAEVARHWDKMQPFWNSGNPAYVGLTKGTPPETITPKSNAQRLADLEAKANDPIGPISPTLAKALKQQDLEP